MVAGCGQAIDQGLGWDMGFLLKCQSAGLALLVGTFVVSTATAQPVPLGNGKVATPPAVAATADTPNTSKPSALGNTAAKEIAAPISDDKLVAPDAGAKKADELATDKKAADQGKPTDKAVTDKTKAAAAASAAAAAPVEDSGGAAGRPNLPNSAVPKFGADGALHYAYDLDVPDFHSIEPSLSLGYDSGRKTKLGASYQGWLGFGWGMDGFDTIERQRPRGGVPAFDGPNLADFFDGNDVYLVNGSEMVPCVANSPSPSCQTGGNFSTETEGYQRILLDKTNSIWTVTQKDGTQLKFLPVGALMPNATVDVELANYSKWYLQKVTDTNGNIVTYSYDCPALPVCYPKTISYGPYTINFFLEGRPDRILMANGKSISTTDKRIKTVTAKIGARLISAWGINYAQAPNSGTTRLAAVRKFGSDAVIDASGTISAGTALPTVIFTYRDANLTYTAKDVTISNPTCPAGGLTETYQAGYSLTDLDQDAKADIIGTCNVYMQGRDGTNYDSLSQYLTVGRYDSLTSSSSQKSLLLQAQTYIGGNQPPYYLNQITGSFVSPNQNKSIIQYTFALSYAGGEHNYSTIQVTSRKAIIFNSSLQPAFSDCTVVTSPYYADCSKVDNLPYISSSGDHDYVPKIVKATDLTGTDRLYQVDSPGVLTADFFGDGTNEVLRRWRNSATVWFQSGFLPGGVILTTTTPFTASAGLALNPADINGDGLTDLVSRQTDNYVSGSV